MNNIKETYLGDGLYASYDGWQFKLRAPRAKGDHETFLEPHVICEFFAYVEKSIPGLLAMWVKRHP